MQEPFYPKCVPSFSRKFAVFISGTKGAATATDASLCMVSTGLEQHVPKPCVYSLPLHCACHESKILCASNIILACLKIVHILTIKFVFSVGESRETGNANHDHDAGHIAQVRIPKY